MAFNKVLLIGNVGNDPEIRYLDNNPQNPQGMTKVASFSLATTGRYKDRNGETRENTTWHRLSAWRNTADIVEKFVHKGDQIYVEGKLTTRQWQDQQGNTHTTTEIQVANIQLLGKRETQPAPTQAAAPAPQSRKKATSKYDVCEHFCREKNCDYVLGTHAGCEKAINASGFKPESLDPKENPEDLPF